MTCYSQTGSQTVPILVSRLRESGGTKTRKSESRKDVSKMPRLVCLGYVPVPSDMSTFYLLKRAFSLLGSILRTFLSACMSSRWTQNSPGHQSHFQISPGHQSLFQISSYSFCAVVAQRWTKRWSLGCEKLLPGTVWLLLIKTGPPFCQSLYLVAHQWLITG